MKIFYDLNRAPPTFDCVSWLCHESVDLDCDLDMVVIPEGQNSRRSDQWWPHSRGARWELVERILKPVARLHPRILSMETDATPRLARTRYGHRVMMRAFRRGARPLRSREPRPFSGPYVTITLRDAEHWSARNSNIPEWIAAAERIAACGMGVVVIPDTARKDAPVPYADPLAAEDISRRAQLYQHAVLNMGVNNGPMWLAAAMDTPVAIFRPVAEGVPSASEEFFHQVGMEPGNLHPWGAPHQAVHWCADSAANILAAFDAAQPKEIA